MKRIILFTLLVAFSSLTLASNDTTEFKASGSPFAKIFSNYHSGTNPQSNSNGFEISRAYFGYKYEITSDWSAKVNLDVGNPKAGGLEMTAYLKEASLTFHKEKLTMQFGMIPMKQFKLQEKHWGYRYIMKSFQDEYKYANSADIGVSAQYKPNKIISFDITASNGEGYKKIQSDETYRGGLGLTVKPFKSFTFRYYYDYMEKGNAQSTHALFLGYKFKNIFSIGAEYDYRDNHDFETENDVEGYSFYATYFITKKWNVFGRFDKVSSKKEGNEFLSHNIDGDYYIAGFEYKATKGVNISLNHRYFADLFGSISDNSYIYLNFEYSF